MHECFECSAIELQVNNLERAVEWQKEVVFKFENPEEEWNRRFDLLLALVQRLEFMREQCENHLATHCEPHSLLTAENGLRARKRRA